MSMDGILCVDKPRGWTSFDVVAKVRGIIRAQMRQQNPDIKRIKVGHTGTLDPAATGLLVLCVGKATKLVPQFTKLDKTYDVEFTLGVTSSTDDSEGILEKIHDAIPPSETTVKTTLNSFLGEQEQVPPQYSAIKVNGRRAYESARKGQAVELKPRLVTIYEISNYTYSWPIVHCTIRVSSGTYIRSIARDLGDRLGVGAYMSALRRLNVGQFDVMDAMSLDSFSFEAIKTNIRSINNLPKMN